MISEEMVLEKLDRMDRKSVYSSLTVIITYWVIFTFQENPGTLPKSEKIYCGNEKIKKKNTFFENGGNCNMP